jgi:hypothetical protein
MLKTSRKTQTAEEIAGMAFRGEDVFAYFANKLTLVGPVRRVDDWRAPSTSAAFSSNTTMRSSAIGGNGADSILNVCSELIA